MTNDDNGWGPVVIHHSSFCIHHSSSPGGLAVDRIRVLVAGVGGRMGRLVAETVRAAPDLLLVGGVDPAYAGADLGEKIVGQRSGMTVDGSVSSAIARCSPQVMVDFTTPDAVMGNLREAIARKVACVVGTTGLTEGDLGEVARLCVEQTTPAIVAPNFSVGACLMMRFAAEAATRFEYAQVMEFHHAGKKDAPSGTALATVEHMARTRAADMKAPHPERLTLEGVMGGQLAGIGVHAARMDGVVADQRVMLGGPGETLTIEHRTTSRECFIPGVLLAVRHVLRQEALVLGLEKLLG
jgi:4-hydroxy-tetrahydrodipicolinate reductase